MLQAPIRGAAPGSARSCAGARFRGHVASTNGPGSVRAWTASPTARHWWGGHWARRLAAATEKKAERSSPSVRQSDDGAVVAPGGWSAADGRSALELVAEALDVEKSELEKV